MKYTGNGIDELKWNVFACLKITDHLSKNGSNVLLIYSICKCKTFKNSLKNEREEFGIYYSNG